MTFLKICHGKVATPDRRGGQISKIFMSFSRDLTCQKPLKSANFRQSYSKNKRWTFLGQGVEAKWSWCDSVLERRSGAASCEVCWRAVPPGSAESWAGIRPHRPHHRPAASASPAAAAAARTHCQSLISTHLRALSRPGRHTNAGCLPPTGHLPPPIDICPRST